MEPPSQNGTIRTGGTVRVFESYLAVCKGEELVRQLVVQRRKTSLGGEQWGATFGVRVVGAWAEADARAGLTRTVLRQLALVQKSGGSVKLVA
jgi:hypothetical protein